MSVSITHSKVSGRPAGNDPNRIYGTHWDADHVVPVASTAQAQAGTSSDVLMTPASTRTLVDSDASKRRYFQGYTPVYDLSGTYDKIGRAHV